ncbi:hypothetical protein A4X09_0g2144 [Tilletia walkeri]|uniref:3-dehydroquinate dehydratase n=1 Tax=Tilletia walkeri TaxID=117179 RepID=A0A8X7T5Y7_9BASI|nr:hypothetical protein A4X09_0g2144 [Tilletia walkeri]
MTVIREHNQAYSSGSAAAREAVAPYPLPATSRALQAERALSPPPPPQPAPTSPHGSASAPGQPPMLEEARVRAETMVLANVRATLESKSDEPMPTPQVPLGMPTPPPPIMRLMARFGSPPPEAMPAPMSNMPNMANMPSGIPPSPQSLIDNIERMITGYASPPPQRPTHSAGPPPPLLRSYQPAPPPSRAPQQTAPPPGSAMPSRRGLTPQMTMPSFTAMAAQMHQRTPAPPESFLPPKRAPSPQSNLPSLQSLAAEMNSLKALAAELNVPSLRAMSPMTGRASSAGPDSMFSLGSFSPAPEPRKRAYRLPMPHKRATIILIGMRGVGKTTLGLIASSALGLRFIDTDKVLVNHFGMSAQDFVRKWGFQEYCNQEATVFESLLTEYPYDSIISTGGSAIESTRIKEILGSLRGKNAVVHVIREREEVAKYLSLEQNRWRYDEDPLNVWKRREPFYWMSSSVVFVNLSQPLSNNSSNGDRSSPRHPLALKSVAQSFLRLLESISTDGADAATSPPDEAPPKFGRAEAKGYSRYVDDSRMDSSDDIWRRVAPLPGVADATDRESLLRAGQTSYLSLTFPDLRKVDPALFEQVVEGVDAIELRADLLDCLTDASRETRQKLGTEKSDVVVAAQLDYAELAIQIEKVRALCEGSKVPLIFTIRTSREGGKFFDDRDHASGSMESAHMENLYFLLLGIALSMCVEIIDLELAWDIESTKLLAARRGRSKIMCSYHDLVGALRWDSNNARALYDRASSFDPDFVELIGTALTVNQNWHLLSFVSHVNSAAEADPSRPPLIAINMGRVGQPSRPFQRILSPVGHPAQPSVAAPGQLSLQEMTEIAGKLGIITPRKFVLFSGVRGEDGSVGSADVVQARVLRQAIQRIGLPYSIHMEGESGRMTMLDHFLSNNFGGAAFASHSYDVQGRLFEIAKQEDTTFSLSEDAIVVGGVDVVCLAELEPQNARGRGGGGAGGMRTAQGREAPRCVAHHSLPRVLEQSLTNHLNPLNKAGRESLAVIVVPQSENWHAGMTIGVKSAARAVQKSGFGYCAVVVCGSYPEVVDLSDLIRSFIRPPEEKEGATKFELQRSGALVDLPGRMKVVGDSSGGAAAGKAGGVAIRPPSAVILVGGSEGQHELALSSILDVDPSSVGSSLSPAERVDLPLPAEMWSGPLGGVCISVPTSSSSSSSASTPPPSSSLEAKLLKRGWMSVSPSILEFERLTHGIFEPWTRKRAPMATMRGAYLRAVGGGGDEAVGGGMGEDGMGGGGGGDMEMEVDGHVESGKGKGKGKERDPQGAAEALAGMRFG